VQSVALPGVKKNACAYHHVIFSNSRVIPEKIPLVAVNAQLSVFLHIFSIFHWISA
jgi:hypothetical protein